MGWINFLISTTKTYWGSIAFLALFTIAVAVVLFLENDKKKQHTFIWYSGIVLLFIYNPVTYLACRFVFRDPETFQQYFMRFYSLIPVFAIIAYAMTLGLSKLSGNKKLIGLVACLFVFAVAGNLVYRNDWYTKAENSQKVPQDVLELVEIFQEDIDAGKTIHMLAPSELAVYIRQIESKFSLPYTRQAEPIDAELVSKVPNAADVLDYAAGEKCKYVVTIKNPSTATAFKHAGFKKYKSTTNYDIYTLPKVTWVLTEYPDDSGNQGMFYTMENVKDKSLIVIDGGSPENEQRVRQVIKKKGGTVNLWIITHYHRDHVGAFNEIAGDPQGIVIQDVIATPLDQDVFYERAQDWDDVDQYDAFLYCMSDSSSLVYVERGDSLYTLFDGLTISFFNGYDDIVKDMEDVPNNASLVFKMETENRSILFCSDAHSEALATYLRDTYEGELRADILQVGHHGHNSMPIDTEFYVLVEPKIAIFDAPEWLMTGDNYTAKDLAAYLEEEGVSVKSFSTAPNYFAFY